MQMKPPADCTYNTRKVKAGKCVEVKAQDAGDLEAVGWKHEKTRTAKPAKRKEPQHTAITDRGGDDR